jgi:hypothetical protein
MDAYAVRRERSGRCAPRGRGHERNRAQSKVGAASETTVGIGAFFSVCPSPTLGCLDPTSLAEPACGKQLSANLAGLDAFSVAWSVILA